MTREERFKMEMLDEFAKLCAIAENQGNILSYKNTMLKALKAYKYERQEDDGNGGCAKASEKSACLQMDNGTSAGIKYHYG